MNENYDYIRQVYEKKFENSIKKVRNVDEQFPFIIYAIKKYGDSNNIQILDAGCGDGRYMLALHERGYKNVNGFDLFDSVSEKELHYRKGSIDDIPFENEQFNVVYCTSALYYLMDVEKGVAELVRVTKSGGIILCTVTTKYSLYTLKRRLNIFFRVKGTEHLDYYHFRYSILDYKHFFEAEGCTVELIDGFRMPLINLIKRCIRKIVRIIIRNTEFDFSRKIMKNRFIGYIKAFLGYHAVIIVKKQ